MRAPRRRWQKCTTLNRYLGQMIHDQRGRNAQAKDQRVRKVLAGNGAPLAQQHRQYGRLAIRVRRIAGAAIVKWAVDAMKWRDRVGFVCF